MRSPHCWRYKASPCPKPCPPVTPCSPCRPVCTPCRPAVVTCTADDCCQRERFSSSCSPLYSPPPKSCTEPIQCCPRERFTSSCSSPRRETATRPDTECAPCDLDNYCIRYSPISCNPCLGRRSFRHCSSFTRPTVPYCNWCKMRDDEKDSGPSRKESRKSQRQRGSRSSSVNTNVRRSSSRKPSLSDTAEQLANDDPNKRVFMSKKSKNSRKSSRKSTLKDSKRRSSSKAEETADDVDNGDVRPSSSARASRRSSANDNVQRTSSVAGSFVNDYDKEPKGVDKEPENFGDRRRSSSVTAAPRASRTSPQHDGSRNSSRNGHTSQPSGDSGKRRERFTSKTKFSSIMQKFRRRKTPRRSSRARQSSRAPSRSSGSLRSSSSRSSSHSAGNLDKRKLSSRASGAGGVDNDVRNEVDFSENLVKPLAECIAGIIHESVGKKCDSRQHGRCCAQIPTVPHPPGYCADGRCSSNAWNPRDRFSLQCLPFYRSGHKVFPGTTRPHQPRRASVVAYGDRRQSYGATAEFVPDARGTNRQASSTAAVGHARSSSPRSVVQTQGLVRSVPPPGTSLPRPTFTSTSSRQMSVAAPRPPFAGYREHYVTTTNQTVRYRQEQNLNRTSNVAIRIMPSSEDGRRDVLIDTRHATSAPAVASATEGSGSMTSVPDRDLAAKLDETKRGIMEAFDKAQKSLQ